MNGVAHFSAWGILRGGHQAEGADFHRALKECMWLWTSRWWERTFRVEGDLDTDKVLRSLWNEPSVNVAESCLMRQFRGLVQIAARTKGRIDWRSEIEGIVIELTRCTLKCLMYYRRCYWSTAASLLIDEMEFRGFISIQKSSLPARCM